MNAQVDKLIEVIRRIVNKLYPELANRYHLPARARVLSINGSIKLQPLKNDGSDDTGTPVIICDPVPYTLQPGNVVRIGYVYGDPSEPFAAPLSTVALGTYTGTGFKPDGHNKEYQFILAKHLDNHFRIATLTEPVDDEGNPLPGATTSQLTRIDYVKCVKPGNRVAAVPMEEGDRFVIIAKIT